MSDPTTLDIWILTCTSDLRFLPTAEAAGGTEAVFCTEVVAQASSDKCSWIIYNAAVTSIYFHKIATLEVGLDFKPQPSRGVPSREAQFLYHEPKKEDPRWR